MSNIKKVFNQIFFHKIIRSFAIPIIIINAVFILFLFVISLFVDYQEIYKKLAFSEIVEFQATIFILFAVFEIGLVSIISYRFLSNSANITSNIKELIIKGENNKVEFKSSLRIDMLDKKVNKELEYVIAKTISAFLNTQGGTILIGIDDNGKILGIRDDYETLKKKNLDGFIVYLTQIINYFLGKEVHRHLNISVELFQEKEICLIQILPSKKPVYVHHNDHKEFFIRTASSVQPMDVRDTHDYIINHWK